MRSVMRVLGDARPTQVPAVRSVGRAVVRSAGMATAPVRSPPDYLIIGAKRGGTTSMYRYLAEHPQVLGQFPSARRLPLRAETKGAHYFDTNWHRGSAWYWSHFPSAAHRWVVTQRLHAPAIAGEASPYYLFHPLAAQRARDTVPDVRLIVLLRNPIDRAHSHYWEQRRRGLEPLGSFEEAISAEPARLAGEAERLVRDARYHSPAHEHQSYISQSRYLESLDRWLGHYPRAQFHVIRSEDLYTDPQTVYAGVLRFLGLEPHPLSNPAPFNAGTGQPLDPALRSRLAREFAPHNEALERRLGRTFEWDAT